MPLESHRSPLHEAVTVAHSEGSCVLISDSCTTGWFDWVHGELWLCPTGLLRRSLGLPFTIRRAFFPQDRSNRWRLTMTEEQLVEIRASDPRAIWVVWDDIARVTLKSGIIDHSLHVDLVGGGRKKFLWLAGDGDFELLEAFLTAAVGSRLVLHRAPIG